MRDIHRSIDCLQSTFSLKTHLVLSFATRHSHAWVSLAVTLQRKIRDRLQFSSNIDVRILAQGYRVAIVRSIHTLHSALNKMKCAKPC